MSISQIRYQQQSQQLRSTPKPGVGTITSYETRDEITGLRVTRTADGGVGFAQYISNSQPGGTLALTISASIGLPGYISQKPY